MSVYVQLAERIRGEVLELERVLQRAERSWVRARSTPEEYAFLDSVALNLHAFYSGLEWSASSS